MSIRSAFVALAILATASSSTALAAPVSFVLDSSLSQLTIAAVVDLGGGLSTVGQAEDPNLADHAGLSDGSISFYSGVINADVGPGSIQFTGGSTIDAAITSNELGWAPKANPTDNTLTFEPADYGFVLAIVYASIQNVLFDSTSGVLPVAGGSFTADHSLTFNGGLLSFIDTFAIFITDPPYGTSDLTEQPPLPSNSPVAGTLTPGPGNTLTLSLPVKIKEPIMLGDVALDLSIEGVLVGTAVIPEPASLSLVGVAIACGSAAWIGRRKIRRAHN